MGAEGRTADFAETYRRISALALPFVLVTLAGQGYLRGVADLRTPLLVVVAGNVLNVVLEVLFVCGFHWGIEGSAAGTAIAQAAMGSVFAWRLLVAAREQLAVRLEPMRRLLRTGGHILVRTGSLIGAFVLGSAVVARFGEASLGAHQVAFQLWVAIVVLIGARLALMGARFAGRRWVLVGA